jgi:hypothetical protein
MIFKILLKYSRNLQLSFNAKTVFSEGLFRGRIVKIGEIRPFLRETLTGSEEKPLWYTFFKYLPNLVCFSTIGLISCLENKVKNIDFLKSLAILLYKRI